jgi:hypothetical protein
MYYYIACYINATTPITSKVPTDTSMSAALFGFAAGVVVLPETRSASTLVPVAVSAETEVDAGADPEAADKEAGFGHGFLYTYCSGFPLQVLAFVASYVPFGYIQQVPEENGERSSVRGLKTT